MNEEKSLYGECGYVVVRGYISNSEVDNANSEILEVLKGNRKVVKGGREFKEKSILDVVSEYMSCHIVHHTSEFFLNLMKHDSARKLLKDLIGENVKCMHSNYFFKYAGNESSKGHGWHQDEFFIPTRDRSLTAIWIALDDVSIDTGCLKVLPGSHKSGVLWPMKEHNDPTLDRSLQSYNFPFEASDCEYLELSAGDAVAFNGYLLHGSGQNKVPLAFRRSLVYFYMSAESLLPWDHTGQRESSSDCRDIHMVLGNDPYEYKGYENTSIPYVRKIGASEADLNHAKKEAKASF
ncbi:phytanoyl-CoA dioxygenase family protein [Pseudoalteromonas maricaloris]|uniref:phytanoyl-CoA dioxygenase family protein n=1 Tax=Pseudoalteromonas maricaloris TaxID=184924 RepID=UPI00029AFBAB|nr:phytanoyl-CoA dioxygenase family protein [Pseudoalteromonas flavipulchra]